MYEAFERNNNISFEYMEKYGVKRGLRNSDGTGVMAGVTNICNVHGYVVDDGEKQPARGKLIFRGYNINELVERVMSENRYGFEEIVFLLLSGKLPDKNELEEFSTVLSDNRALPGTFFEDMILKAPSPDIMNKMARSILALYSYDPDPESKTAEHEVDTAISLIAKMPVIMICANEAKKRFYKGDTMILHPLIKGTLVRVSAERGREGQAKLLIRRELCKVQRSADGGCPKVRHRNRSSRSTQLRGKPRGRLLRGLLWKKLRPREAALQRAPESALSQGKDYLFRRGEGRVREKFHRGLL